MSCSCKDLKCMCCGYERPRTKVIKHASPQELMQNEHVNKLMEDLAKHKAALEKCKDQRDSALTKLFNFIFNGEGKLKNNIKLRNDELEEILK